MLYYNRGLNLEFFRHVSKEDYMCWPYTPCKISGKVGGQVVRNSLRPEEVDLERPYAIDCDMVSFCFVLDAFYLYVVSVAWRPASV